MASRKFSPRSHPTIFTIGHSTRPIDEFLKLLELNRVEILLDIRTVPRSRHNPQFESAALAAALQSSGIGYRHMKDLGGLRKPRADSSVNEGWRNASFRGYADYMQTPAFAEALAQAAELARTKQTVLMCAEAVPWRCHRSLVADALLVRGFIVKDIIGKAEAQEHKLTPFASIEGTQITYPAQNPTSAQLPLLNATSSRKSK